MSNYLKLLWVLVLFSHSYIVFLTARSSKDIVLQAAASGGILCAFILLLVWLLHRHYRQVALILTVCGLVLLSALYLRTNTGAVAFWLLLTVGFAVVQPLSHYLQRRHR